MNVNTQKCDCCGRLKEQSNHWHQIGLYRDDGKITLVLGELGVATTQLHEVHDLCGEQCFFKDIAKLLRLNPTEAE